MAVCFFVYSVSSFFWSISSSFAFEGIKHQTVNFICVFLFILVIDESSHLQLFSVKCFALMPLFLFIRLYIDNGLLIFDGIRNILTEEHNLIGFYSGFGAVWSVFCCLLSNKKKELWLILLTVNLTLLIISMSRQSIAYLIFPLFFSYLLCCNSFSKKIIKIFFIIIVIGVGHFLIFNISTLYNYIGKGIEDIIFFVNTGYGDPSSEGRLVRIKVGIDLFVQRPVWGWGIQAFNYFFSFERDTVQLVADCNFIDILVNFGCVGFILYYSIFLMNCISFFTNSDNYRLSYSLPFSVLITMFVSDFWVSSYSYLHILTMLSLVSCMLMNKKNNMHI